MSLLDSVRVASPCRQAWEDMAGDDRVRFCRACRQKVYDLAGFTHREAEALLAEREGRVCVRLFRREDGTILARDCPAAFRRAARWTAGVCASLVGMFGAILSGRPERFRWWSAPDVIPAPPAHGSWILGSAYEVSSFRTVPVRGRLLATPRLDERWLVSLEPVGDVAAGARWPDAYRIEFRGGRFDPEEIAVCRTRTFVVSNAGPEAIRVRADTRGLGAVDWRIAPGGRLVTTFPGAEEEFMLRAGDAEARVRVMAWPWFTWSRPDGSFELPSVPGGEYRAEVWRRGLAPVVQDVVVPETGCFDLEREAPGGR